MKTDDRLKRIAFHYGLYPQLEQLQEECAELIQAVHKYKRNREVASHISCAPPLLEEIADVEIMIEQIRLLINEDDNSDIERIKDAKLDRQIIRMEHEKYG